MDFLSRLDYWSRMGAGQRPSTSFIFCIHWPTFNVLFLPLDYSLPPILIRLLSRIKIILNTLIRVCFYLFFVSQEVKRFNHKKSQKDWY